MYHLPNNLFKHIIGSVIEERGSRRDYYQLTTITLLFTRA